MKEIVIKGSKYKLSSRANNIVVKDIESNIVTIKSITSIENVCIYGNPHVTSPLIKTLATNGVGLHYFSSSGRYICSLSANNQANFDHQQKQFQALTDSHFRLELAKQIIKNKINMQVDLLEAYNVEHLISSNELKQIRHKANDVLDAKNMHELLGIEGRAAKSYFFYLNFLVQDEFKFRGRSKHPAKDPFNVLLNIGYSHLHHYVIGAIMKYGLNTGFGIIHKPHRKHHALASDLMEVWRAIVVDDVVMHCVKENLIQLNQFSITKDAKSMIDDTGLKLLINLIGKRILEKHHYILSNKKFFSCAYTIDLQIESLIKAFSSLNVRDFVLVGEGNEEMV